MKRQEARLAKNSTVPPTPPWSQGLKAKERARPPWPDPGSGTQSQHLNATNTPVTMQIQIPANSSTVHLSLGAFGINGGK